MKLNVLRPFALVLFFLLLASALRPVRVEKFTSLVSDDYKKVEMCKSLVCSGGDDASCVSNCYSSIQDASLCPPSVTEIERTDSRGFRLGSINGKQCIHVL